MPPAENVPADVREITFPADVTAWGWTDATRGGSAFGCPDALPNASDPASVDQTTAALQCRFDNMGFSAPPSLFLPAGTYYINKTLSMVNTPNRSWITNLVHISGEDPARTQIVWAGSCETDPAVADPSKVTKYNDVLYFSGMSNLSIERLTLDGKNCAGDGLDLVSKPVNMSPVLITEMTIQNMKEVGIVGDRDNLTTTEIAEGDSSGMVSEVSIERVTLAHIGYGGVMTGAFNALDWWIRDSLFDDCNIAVTNSAEGTANWMWGQPGIPQTPGLAWGNTGHGNFSISNSVFRNSRTADIMGGNAVRGCFSTASHGPFILSNGAIVVQGNTVVASPDVLPTFFGLGLGLNDVTLLQNQVVTSNDAPAVLFWSVGWGQVYPTTALQGASPVVGTLWNDTYSNLVSVGNVFSSAKPFSMADHDGLSKGSYTVASAPGWAPTPEFLQCGPAGVGPPALVDGRTYCSTSNGQGATPAFNLLSIDDQRGAALSPKEFALPPVRPLVARHYVIPTLQPGHDPTVAGKNAAAIQAAVDALVARQTSCAADDYPCPDRWAVVMIPVGFWDIGSPIDIPAKAQIQVVGSWATYLRWYWDSSNQAMEPTQANMMFRVHAPSQVVMRDLNLQATDIANGIVAEVEDRSTSRVMSDTLSLDGWLSSLSIGNVGFDMRNLRVAGGANVYGDGTGGTGYFAYYMGNPAQVTVGAGANLMIQDTWYEGPDSRYVTCQDGDRADVTIESSMLSMGGWHGQTPDTETTINVAGCATTTAVIASAMLRDGFEGKAPSQSVILPATASSDAHVLLLQDLSDSSTYSPFDSSLVIPAGDTSVTSLDQGYFLADPATPARYANVLGTFLQAFDANAGQGETSLAARNTGALDASFVRDALKNALDPRISAPPRLLAPVLDAQSSDLRLERVSVRWGGLDEVQFVLPGKLK